MRPPSDHQRVRCRHLVSTFWVHFAEDWGEGFVGRCYHPGWRELSVYRIPEGTYDLQAEDADGNIIATLWEAEIAGENTWTVTMATVSLEVINGSEHIVAALYVSPSSSDSWGDDWLGGVAIKSGGAYVVEGLESDVYDVKAEDADGDVIEIVYNLELSGEYSWNIVGKADLPSNAVLRFEDDFTDNRNNWGATTETDDVYYMTPEMASIAF